MILKIARLWLHIYFPHENKTEKAFSSSVKARICLYFEDQFWIFNPDEIILMHILWSWFHSEINFFQFSLTWWSLYGLKKDGATWIFNSYQSLKVKRILNILGFPPLGLLSSFNFFLAFFQFSWPSDTLPSDVLNIQNHSNLSYPEAILPWKQFLLKIWLRASQSLKIWNCIEFDSLC